MPEPDEAVVAVVVDDGVVVDGRRLPRLEDDDPRPRSLVPALLVGTTVLRVVAGPAEGPVLPLDGLDESPDLVEALRRAIASLEQPTPPLRPGWYAPGFVADAEAWVDGLGLARSGPAEVVKLWSLSAVLRVPLGEGAAFLKACCPHFHHEPALTRVLSRRLGDRVPTVLGTHDERGWLLMDALPGGEADVVETVALLADLQVEVVGRLDDLRAAGAPERGARATLEAFAGVVSEGLELDDLTPAERDRLPALVPWLGEHLDRLGACGMPDSLVHGDLHPGNAASDGRRTTIYDWSDTAIGAPVLDAFMLARHLEREDRVRAVAAYAGRWRDVAPDADVVSALELAAVPNDAYQVVTYDAIMRGQEELSRWELAGVVPRILRRMLETHAAG